MLHTLLALGLLASSALYGPPLYPDAEGSFGGTSGPSGAHLIDNAPLSFGNTQADPDAWIDNNGTMMCWASTSVDGAGTNGDLFCYTLGGNLVVFTANLHVGATADAADFPNARMIVSQGDTGDSAASFMGLVVEAEAGAQAAIAIRGTGRTTGATQANGVFGIGKVTATGDTGPAVGLIGFSGDTHSGGDNIAGQFYATGGANNYAIQIAGGDVHALVDNQWLIGANSASADFQNARMIVSAGDTGATENTPNIGLAVESSGGTYSVGLYSVATTSGALLGVGVQGVERPANGADAGKAVALSGTSTQAHAGGPNVALLANAASGATNYAFQAVAGDFQTLAAADWDLVANNASALSFDTAALSGILNIDTATGAEGVSTSGYFACEGANGKGATTRLDTGAPVTVTFAANPGDASKTATSFRIAQKKILGVSGRVVVAGTNCATVDIGDGADVDRYGAAIAVSAGTVFDIDDATADPEEFLTGAGDVVITANGGNCFDLSVKLTLHWRGYQGATVD